MSSDAPAPRPTSDRFDYVDCLRGLAILGVVLVHAAQIVPGLGAHLRSVADAGSRGVQLFFVVSAFTLLSAQAGKPFKARGFYVRRYFRIAPAFYLAAAFYLATRGAEPHYFSPDGIGLHQVLLTLTFLHGWWPDAINSIVPGGWSIAAEATFYLLFPFLLSWIKDLRSAAIAFAAGVVLALAARFALLHLGWGDTPHRLVGVMAHFWFPTHLPSFLGGLLAFYAARALAPYADRPQLRRAAAWALPGLSVGFVAAAALDLQVLTNAIAAAGFFTVFVVATGLSQPRWLVTAPLRYLGVVSFSVYLVHFAVLDLIKPFVPPPGALPAPAVLAAVFTATLVGATALATLSYRLVEAPFVAWARRMTRDAALATIQPVRQNVPATPGRKLPSEVPPPG